MSDERKLATIQVIKDLQPIEGADKIVLATMEDNSWQVVVQKDQFDIGQRIIYLEIDSWVPTELAPFLSKGKEPREYEGVKGERLKTIRLRGVLSQGLILPITLDATGDLENEVGTDMTEMLGIKKCERAIPASLQGRARGNFPMVIRKTDQERVQNRWNKLQKRREQYPDEVFEVTEKLDGSSMTVYITSEGRFGVCSRNLDLEETEDNAFWKVARKLDLETRMKPILDGSPGGAALQFELVGPGVQGNLYGLKELDAYLFDVWNIADQKYVHPSLRNDCFIHSGDDSVKHVPVVDIRKFDFQTIEEVLTYAEGKSMLNSNVEREGVVFKSEMDPSFSFKAISNSWLLKNDG